MNIYHALHTVVDQCPSFAAASYATAALDMALDPDPDNPTELRVQVLYVLSNATYWRGDQARTVKHFLRQWVKENPTH